MNDKALVKTCKGANFKVILPACVSTGFGGVWDHGRESLGSWEYALHSGIFGDGEVKSHPEVDSM